MEIPQLESEGKIFSPREIADMMGVHYITVVKALNKGSLPGFRIGRQWKVSENQLRDFINSGGDLTDPIRKRSSTTKALDILGISLEGASRRGSGGDEKLETYYDIGTDWDDDE